MVPPVPLGPMPDPEPPVSADPSASAGPSAVANPSRTALPSVGARILAFVAILLAGVAGGVIGYAFADLQCRGDCTLWTGTGALLGAIIAAAGTAVVVVLTLRAMGEWRTIQAVSPERATRTPDGGVRRQPRVR